MKCDACPRSGDDCAAAHHPRYCELATADATALAVDPAFDAYWLRFLAGPDGAARFPEPAAPVRAAADYSGFKPRGCCG